MRGRTKVQAPWFFGSSWHQTISALGKRFSSCASTAFGEGIKLFQPQHLDAAFVLLLALFHQVEIDLAGAQDDALDLRRRAPA